MICLLRNSKINQKNWIFQKKLSRKKRLKKLADLKQEGLKVEQKVQEMTVELGKIQEKINILKISSELEEMENAVRENNGDIEKMQSKIDWKKNMTKVLKNYLIWHQFLII